MTTVIGTGPTTPEEFAALVNTEWRKSVEGIFGAGRWLVQAKAELDHGEFGQMFAPRDERTDKHCVFGQSTADKLMHIANHRLSNSEHVTNLPPSWGTLYALSALNEDEWAIVEKGLSPTLERGEIKKLLRKNAPDPDPATPKDETNGSPWGDEDKWCWKLKNLYTQAPKRSQKAFRKWVVA